MIRTSIGFDNRYVPRSRTRVLALLGVLLVVAAAGVALMADKDTRGGQSAGASRVMGSVQASDRVEINAFEFMPAAAEAKAGSKVTFINNDAAAHTATSKTVGAFDTDMIKKGKSKSVTLKEPGEFNYICAYHPFMKGKIRVVR